MRVLGASGGEGQAALLDAFGGHEFIGDLLDVEGLAPQDQHLETLIVIEMNVECGNDFMMMVVLQAG